jgi:hypothetical protein
MFRLAINPALSALSAAAAGSTRTFNFNNFFYAFDGLRRWRYPLRAPSCWGRANRPRRRFSADARAGAVLAVRQLV